MNDRLNVAVVVGLTWFTSGHGFSRAVKIAKGSGFSR